MGSLKVAKRSNAGPEEIGTSLDVVAIDEAISLLVADEFVAAGDLITDGETAIKGFIDPTAFGFPVGDGGWIPCWDIFFGDKGIEGEFHLVDGDVIGGEFENLIDEADQFSSVSPIMPAMRSILTWAKPTSRIQSQVREDFGG